MTRAAHSPRDAIIAITTRATAALIPKKADIAIEKSMLCLLVRNRNTCG
jgi:hypothetical protein